ncbi:21399_t:CDS:2 [Cetraspora pellucida]|uniref:21399_t:CDS:1 n=1 Tax=Cetraspora pellucida TaxID=1433469 RepID=A0A9N8ZET9_9GLOM|nr:21399_t:CDS:2 [Cetraspora pellucida]
MSLKPLSKRELAKKYSKRSELLKSLEINFLKSYSNSLANDIIIPKLENCHECNEEIFLNLPKAFTMLVCDHTLHYDCLEKSNRDKQKTCSICFIDNEGPASAEVQDVNMTEAVEGESEKTSNLTGEVSKLSVDDDRAIPQSKTKFMESEKVQGLIKELSMPREPINDNNRENKTRKSKPKTLLQCWYLFAKKFEERVKEIKNNNSRFNDQQARGLVYGEIATNISGFTRKSLCKKTAKTRNIYKLFGESYDPETKTVVKRLEIKKIE